MFSNIHKYNDEHIIGLYNIFIFIINEKDIITHNDVQNFIDTITNTNNNISLLEKYDKFMLYIFYKLLLKCEDTLKNINLNSFFNIYKKYNNVKVHICCEQYLFNKMLTDIKNNSIICQNNKIHYNMESNIINIVSSMWISQLILKKFIFKPNQINILRMKKCKIILDGVSFGNTFYESVEKNIKLIQTNMIDFIFCNLNSLQIINMYKAGNNILKKIITLYNIDNLKEVFKSLFVINDVELIMELMSKCNYKFTSNDAITIIDYTYNKYDDEHYETYILNTLFPIFKKYKIKLNFVDICYLYNIYFNTKNNNELFDIELIDLEYLIKYEQIIDIIISSIYSLLRINFVIDLLIKLEYKNMNKVYEFVEILNVFNDIKLNINDYSYTTFKYACFQNDYDKIKLYLDNKYVPTKDDFYNVMLTNYKENKNNTLKIIELFFSYGLKFDIDICEILIIYDLKYIIEKYELNHIDIDYNKLNKIKYKASKTVFYKRKRNKDGKMYTINIKDEPSILFKYNKIEKILSKYYNSLSNKKFQNIILHNENGIVLAYVAQTYNYKPEKQNILTVKNKARQYLLMKKFYPNDLVNN
jgi:hypothetical protein